VALAHDRRDVRARELQKICVSAPVGSTTTTSAGNAVVRHREVLGPHADHDFASFGDLPRAPASAGDSAAGRDREPRSVSRHASGEEIIAGRFR